MSGHGRDSGAAKPAQCRVSDGAMRGTLRGELRDDAGVVPEGGGDAGTLLGEWQDDAGLRQESGGVMRGHYRESGGATPVTKGRTMRGGPF